MKIIPPSRRFWLIAAALLLVAGAIVYLFKPSAAAPRRSPTPAVSGACRVSSRFQVLTAVASRAVAGVPGGGSSTGCRDRVG